MLLKGLQGDARLQHVGNAINQVSKVFNDGTREMTKGSMVYQYTDNESGQPRGIEYCRVFTKDIPYLTNSELQKENGMTNENRRFQYSILDKTYNLNIAPFRRRRFYKYTRKQSKKIYVLYREPSVENIK